MFSPLLRLLTVSVLLAGALAGSALASRPGAAQLAAPPGTPPAPPGTPLATPSGTPPAPCHRNSFGNSRLFPETGFAVSGDFINYWDRNGGLSQQGYPISAVVEEVSDLDGKPYQVQYFERAVFECHPDNLGSQFAVLLAQLGTFQYRQKYPQGAPGQRPNGERPLVFAETGHTLGGEFRTYWEEHGGKYQQGLPLSDEFSEVSPLDGKPYTVQYFERAVFEYHPENAPPYRVLLSLLGTLRYRAKYATPPGPPPVALPTPDPGGPQFLGYVTPGSPCPLVAGGAYLFWPDANSPYGAALLGYDVNAQRQLSAALARDLGVDLGVDLVTDGHTLAWEEARRDPTSGTNVIYIHGYNLRTGREFAPLRVPEGIGGFAVDHDTFYKVPGEAGSGRGSELYASNWTTGQTTRIATATAGSQFGGVVAGNGYVAWIEENSDYSHTRLYLASAQNPGAATIVTTVTPANDYVASFIIAGDHLVWTQSTTVDYEVHMYTISTRTTQVLYRGSVGDLSASENRVAWRVPNPYNYNDRSPAREVVLDFRTGQQSSHELPADVGTCVTLAGSALAYIRECYHCPAALYLQPLP